MRKCFSCTAIILAICLTAVSLSAADVVTASPLLISVPDAIKAKRNNPRTIFIDVRREDAFKKIHIPDSINVPLHFVKTKGYLKNMYVILVGQGHLRSNLLQQAELLNKKGFEAVVLAGGVAGWSQTKNPLAGSEFQGKRNLHLVQPALSSITEFSRYIDVSAEKIAGNSLLASKAEHIPVSSQDDLSVLAGVIQEEGKSPLDTVLLFNKDGDYGLLEGLADSSQPTLFFLQGGNREYERVLHRQKAILEPKAKRMKTIGGCQTCPPDKPGIKARN